jgi:3-phenylpropionate/cinnamic acid dioxygenase small subunit
VFDATQLTAILQLYALYGHLMDDRAFERFDELFTSDCVFDATALGVPLMHGIDAVVESTRSSPQTPLAHHVTNVYVESIEAEVASVRAKAIGIYSRGRAFSGTYDDTLVRTPAGWRIARRVNRPAASSDTSG